MHRSYWSHLKERLREHPLARAGPGLITGVADDDPSGIATYSQAGAQFGLNMLWTILRNLMVEESAAAAENLSAEAANLDRLVGGFNLRDHLGSHVRKPGAAAA